MFPLVAPLVARSLWRRPLMVELGELSFGFYLVHLLVIRDLERFVGFHPGLDPIRAVALTAASFTVSVAWPGSCTRRSRNPPCGG